MKSIINKEIDLENKYPYLGISDDNGLIILFTEKETGIAVNPDCNYAIGHYSNTWFESQFKVFKGNVILSND